MRSASAPVAITGVRAETVNDPVATETEVGAGMTDAVGTGEETALAPAGSTAGLAVSAGAPLAPRTVGAVSSVISSRPRMDASACFRAIERALTTSLSAITVARSVHDI